MQVNHLDVVQRLHGQQPPARTVEGALAFLLRVLAALPSHERAGLLSKPAGENIVDFQGQMVSAGRICYPDGHIYKILTDIPTTNGPGWADDGTVDVSRYIPVRGDGVVTRPDAPDTPAAPVDLTPILEKLTPLLEKMTPLLEKITHLEALLKDHDAHEQLRHNDVVAHFDELKRIIAAK